MEALISENFLRLSSPLLHLSRSPLNFRSFSTKNFFFHFSSQECRRKRNPIVLCSISAFPDPNLSNYGGWEDLLLLEDPNRSGKLDPFRNFLISIGIYDRKHAFLFSLGFISALAISRVRFSSMVVFPVSVLVFVAGFSVGVAQGGILGGSVKQMGKNQSDFDEKLRSLGAFFNEFDVKISELKTGLEGGMDSNRVELGVIRNCVDIVEYLRSEIFLARKTVEGSIAGDIGFDWEVGKKSNKKTSQKKRELGVISLDFLQFLGGLFQESFIGSKPSKAKDNTKREPTVQSDSGDRMAVNAKGSVSGNEAEESGRNPVSANNIENVKVEQSKLLLGKAKGNAPEMAKNVESVLNNDNHARSDASGVNIKKSCDSKDGMYDNDMFSYDKELNNLDRSLPFMSKQGSFQKMVFQNKYEGRTLENDLYDSVNCNSNQRTPGSEMNLFAAESEASLRFEQILEVCDRSYFTSHRRRSSKLRLENTSGVGFKEVAAKSAEESNLGNQQPLQGMETVNTQSSSTISFDEEFNQNVEEASALLKQAREFLMSQADEEKAEFILYKSASLLSTAVAMKPRSLLAVGQLGNTYLLHGELKLKISQELRILLSRSDALLNEKGRKLHFKGLDSRALSKEKVGSVLVDVCEECEELLVKAGRKYRMALSIDGNDFRALYNWGLALSFRAQLIADIGPEAAFDADKVYLAAIDKFDAMVSRSNALAPDALFRWGVALQQRSHLRPHNSKEKMKLLRQAKSLFEDILCVESDNRQVREALFSCISELNYNGQFEAAGVPRRSHNTYIIVDN